jgi:hypothetical protein
MSYIILRGRWCNIIVLNVHAPCEDNSDDVKGSFYEELGRVFDQFLRYDINILLGDLNAKVGREDNFKPTNGNESSHEINKDNGDREVSFATSKNLVFRSTCSMVATFINIREPPLRVRQPDWPNLDRQATAFKYT